MRFTAGRVLRAGIVPPYTLPWSPTFAPAPWVETGSAIGNISTNQTIVGTEIAAWMFNNAGTDYRYGYYLDIEDSADFPLVPNRTYKINGDIGYYSTGIYRPDSLRMRVRSLDVADSATTLISTTYAGTTAIAAFAEEEFTLPADADALRIEFTAVHSGAIASNLGVKWDNIVITQGI